MNFAHADLAAVNNSTHQGKGRLRAQERHVTARSQGAQHNSSERTLLILSTTESRSRRQWPDALRARHPSYHRQKHPLRGLGVLARRAASASGCEDAARREGEISLLRCQKVISYHSFATLVFGNGNVGKCMIDKLAAAQNHCLFQTEVARDDHNRLFLHGNMVWLSQEGGGDRSSLCATSTHSSS